MIRVFISHSKHDEVLLQKVVDLLTSAISGIEPNDIRATSLPAHAFETGVDIDEELRKEVLEADVFICLITPSSIQSVYVMFELGARWGSKKFMANLLAPNVGADLLKGPMSGIQPSYCKKGMLFKFVGDIAKNLECEPRKPEQYERHITAITDLAQSEEYKGHFNLKRPEVTPDDAQTILASFREFIQDIADQWIEAENGKDLSFAKTIMSTFVNGLPRYSERLKIDRPKIETNLSHCAKLAHEIIRFDPDSWLFRSYGQGEFPPWEYGRKILSLLSLVYKELNIAQKH